MIKKQWVSYQVFLYRKHFSIPMILRDALNVFSHIKIMHMLDPTCYLFRAFYLCPYLCPLSRELSNDEA